MNQFRIYNTLFQKNLEQIESYINCIETQKDVINELSCSLIESSLDNKFEKTNEYKEQLIKIVNSPVQYNAVIISLYGSFEELIDNIFKKYIEVIFLSVENYNMLPDKMKHKHIMKTGEFLTNSQRFQNYELTSKTVVENLYNCMNNLKGAKLSEELILSHGGNLRIGQILELMRDFGITSPLDRILLSSEYISFFSNKHEIDNGEAKILIGEKKKCDFEILFSELKQLVEERNNVAHGWRIDNRIAYSVIKSDIIVFLRCFSSIIEKIIFEECYLFLNKIGKLHRFDEAIEVYNGNILCINNLQAKLKRGEFIFAQNNNKFQSLEILNLRIGNETYEIIDEQNIDVGIKVGDRIKKNWRFYYWQ